MAGRFKRYDEIHDKRALIEALRACRSAALVSSRSLNPRCKTADEIHLLIAAIDRLAGHLTGDPTLFHAGGTAPSGTVNGIPLGRHPSRGSD